MSDYNVLKMVKMEQQETVKYKWCVRTTKMAKMEQPKTVKYKWCRVQQKLLIVNY
ncbi:MAG: hypothetical protein LBS69_07015 [Prevotellaceae bacterium]|jgi:hypothetical protein|nr:hypothetical protein [Prevotellaceae bacterium]